LRISDQFDWASWLAAIGMTGGGGQRDLYFSHSHLALQAAAEGQASLWQPQPTSQTISHRAG